MRTKRLLLIAGVLAVGLLLTGCVPQTQTETADPSAAASTAARTVAKVPVEDIADLSLTDDAALYKDQDPASLAHFYITVKGGTAASGTNHTFAEVNSYKNLQSMGNVPKIRTEILFQPGDAYGPLPGDIGYGTQTANATLNVRGRSSTNSPQKSYRIDLYDTAGLWRGQRALALNKHPYDTTRLRNMLFFTLLQRVPGITSLRTQFVQVFIKDETAGETAFSDYGLFTQVELPNGRYLRNHSLSRDGNLYKANMCEFFRYEDQLRLATDPLYDAEAFNLVLEPKTTEDHTKLLAMLDAVNDYTVPIEKTMDTYFNLDNVTSFLAYNILMGNTDTNSQNYLLYSPVNSDVWYFICWDGDGCLTSSEHDILGKTYGASDWQTGVSNYWGMVLFNRMLRVEAYRNALADKMERLHDLITPEVIRAEIARYRTVVDAFTRRMPDLVNLTCTVEQQELIYQRMPNDVETAYQSFLLSLQKPMPFFLGNVTREDDTLDLVWGDAYNFSSEMVSYTTQIATDWSFAGDALVYDGEPQLFIGTTAPMLPPGTYYWRVTAENESGYTQIPFDTVSTDAEHYGMRRFTITDSGEVLNLP